MKKALYLFMVLIISSLIFVGCGSEAVSNTQDNKKLEVESVVEREDSKEDSSNDISNYEDGEYYAEESDYNYGYKGTITIVVEEGNITSVEYKDINEAGNSKSDDEEYNSKFVEKSGISFEEVSDNLEKQLLEKQDFNNVDSVAGATTSSDKFITLGKEALSIK